MTMICRPLSDHHHHHAAPLVAHMTSAEIYSWAYSMYLAIEFARDVEIQTDAWPTSQENIAHFLAQTFNAPGILETWEKPTCVINTFHHDISITAMTEELYVEKVRWYLHLMAPQCQKIIWIGTTAPLTNDYYQKIQQTKDWGLAVRDMFQTDEILSPLSVYFDPYEASVMAGHRDNSTYFVARNKCVCVSPVRQIRLVAVFVVVTLARLSHCASIYILNSPVCCHCDSPFS